VFTSPPTTLLALDPGTKNFGYAVIRFDSKNKIEVLQSGRLFKTVDRLNMGVIEQVERYSQSIRHLVKTHSVSLVVAERYMSRRMGGTTIECVNAMLGILMEICRGLNLRLRLIPASQWKNEINRHSPGVLDSSYAQGKTCQITDHTIDAVFIALYGRSIALKKKAFTGVTSEGVIGAISKHGIVDIGEKTVPVRKARKRGGVRKRRLLV
jgi:Holliday junction resolvasome RuvABC endonuclease subunit